MGDWWTLSEKEDGGKCCERGASWCHSFLEYPLKGKYFARYPSP